MQPADGGLAHIGTFTVDLANMGNGQLSAPPVHSVRDGQLAGWPHALSSPYCRSNGLRQTKAWCWQAVAVLTCDLVAAKPSITALVLGSCDPNWLHGKPRIWKPS